MAIVSLTNQTFGGGTTGASWVFALVNLLVGNSGAGWSKPTDSDGTTYSASGTQVTGGGSGAHGLGNTDAWVRLRAPDGSFELTIQRGSNNLNYRVKVAFGVTFTGGSPGATQTPSATNEAIALGGGTDAAPTFAQLVGQTDAGGYHGQFVAETTAPYRFGAIAYAAGGTNVHSKLLLDWIGAFAAAGDTAPYVLHAAGGSAGADTMDSTSLLDPTSSQAAPRAWLGNPGTGTFGRVPAVAYTGDGNNAVAPDGGSSNPVSSAWDLKPLIYERRSGDVSPKGLKGYSSSLFWRPASTHATSDQYDLSGNGAEDTILLSQVVWTLWPPGVVPTGAAAASTDHGAARLLLTSAPDATAPTVANVVPATNTAIARNGLLQFDVLDAGAALRLVLVTAAFGAGTTPEVAYDGAAFAPGYAGSTVAAINGGLRFVLTRAGGWPGNPVVIPYAVSVTGVENA